MTKLILSGAKGRFGSAVLDCIHESKGQFVMTAAMFRYSSLDDNIFSGVDAVIDVNNSPESTLSITECCVNYRKPLIIATTGHTPEQEESIRERSVRIPIVMTSNFSVGANTLFWLTRKATEVLGLRFDPEIVEMHHRQKKDAPSGTARKLAEIIAKVRELQLEEVARHGRSGLVGERTATEIGIHAIRGGDVVGDHTVILAAVGERVELTHKVSSRTTFANGILRAAQWVADQKPGFYDMQNVLGLK